MANENKMVIGLDFGNYNSFVSCIIDGDPNHRLSGTAYNLLPPGVSDRTGIPSVYFSSQKVGTLVGEAATMSRAKPEENRERYLKQKMGKTITHGDITIDCDRAITAVAEHMIREANRTMQMNLTTTTNQVSLAYPVTFTSAQRQHLVSLVEKATLEDGTPVRVVGTIAEPAAAALDYLAEEKGGEESTVMAFDLGGGTFDLSLVKAYPKGVTNQRGETYYYDVLNVDGLSDVGGKDFDQVVATLMIENAEKQTTLEDRHRKKLQNAAEPVKVRLSDPQQDSVEHYLEMGDEDLCITVTIQEFEERSKGLVDGMVDTTLAMLKRCDVKPDIILLTGGASQMPMIRKALEKALPQYKGKIAIYRPSMAISYGAARFGIAEMDQDPIVQLRTIYDIGVRYKNVKTGSFYINVMIPAGTALPYQSKVVLSHTIQTTDHTIDRVFEAVKPQPDIYQHDTDFRQIMEVRLDYGKEVPEGTENAAQLTVDRQNLLHIKSWLTEDPDHPFKNQVTLTNLSR